MPGMEVVLSVFLCSLFLLCLLAVISFVMATKDASKNSRMVKKLTKKLPTGRSETK